MYTNVSLASPELRKALQILKDNFEKWVAEIYYSSLWYSYALKYGVLLDLQEPEVGIDTCK